MAQSGLRGPSAEAFSVLEKELDASLREVGSRKAAEVGANLFDLAALGDARSLQVLAEWQPDGDAVWHER